VSREFEIRREIELPAAPEAVWSAVATGEGTASWMFPTGEGGPAHEGDTFAGHTAVVFDRPRHLSLRADLGGGRLNALDYRIEPVGSGAVLRYVHSGVLVDDWDAQYDSASRHTDFYLHSLAEYLGHFAGRPVTYVGADGPAEATDPAAFAAVRHALGLDGASVGDGMSVDVPGSGRIEATVDYLADIFIGLRSADALYRFYGRGGLGMPVFAGHHLFAPGADREAEERAWGAWLAAAIGAQPA